jgi:hypothetical protein
VIIDLWSRILLQKLMVAQLVRKRLPFLEQTEGSLPEANVEPEPESDKSNIILFL